MKKRWQALVPSSIITIIFNTVKDINCIFYADHTLSSFAFELFDAGNASLYSGVDSQLMDIGISYFPTVAGVKKIVLTVASASVLRIGEIWSGSYHEVKYIKNDMKVSFDDTSTVRASPDFQYSQLYSKPGEDFELNFPNIDNTERAYINSLYLAKGSGNPFMIDFFEDGRQWQDPRYAIFNVAPSLSRSGENFNMTLKFKEAR
jgi:hypothetical protein